MPTTKPFAFLLTTQIEISRPESQRFTSHRWGGAESCGRLTHSIVEPRPEEKSWGGVYVKNENSPVRNFIVCFEYTSKKHLPQISHSADHIVCFYFNA
ncbi:hypothetical protein J6590_051027 [Homalodisca vitripennis]|nr:hypothetical protein J6590_051027 [Homalodisca vitripennis]